MRASRLGDDIDDFCVKCKRVMNHAVVSLLGDGPAKVRCRTCHSDHDFRHEQPPPPKVDPRKAALFNQVLANAGGIPVAAEAEGAPETGEAAEAGAAESVVAAGGVEPETAAEEIAVAAPKSKGRKKAQV